MSGAAAGLAAAAMSAGFRHVPLSIRVAVFLCILVLAVLKDTGLINVEIPQRHRQIPQTAFRRGLPVGGLRFGVELGLGFRTLIPRSAPYVVLTSLVLFEFELWSSIVAGLAWGLGRSLTAWARQFNRSTTAWDRSLGRPSVPLFAAASFSSSLVTALTTAAHVLSA